MENLSLPSYCQGVQIVRHAPSARICSLSFFIDSSKRGVTVWPPEKEILTGTEWKLKQFIDSNNAPYMAIIGK